MKKLSILILVFVIYCFSLVASQGDSAGFSVSQTFSTVGNEIEPGQPCPCPPCTTFYVEWYAYTSPGNLYLLFEGTGGVGLTLGVYTGSPESFSDLILVGASKTLATGQTAVVQTSGLEPKGTEFFIMLGANTGMSIGLRIIGNSSPSPLPTNYSPSCIATPPPPPPPPTPPPPPPTPPPPHPSNSTSPANSPSVDNS